MKHSLQNFILGGTTMTTREFTVKGKTIKVSEDYNQCDRCGSVQLWDTEMYWQDTMGDGVDHKHMKGYDAVCDKCFHELKASV